MDLLIDARYVAKAPGVLGASNWGCLLLTATGSAYLSRSSNNWPREPNEQAWIISELIESGLCRIVDKEDVPLRIAQDQLAMRIGESIERFLQETHSGEFAVFTEDKWISHQCDKLGILVYNSIELSDYMIIDHDRLRAIKHNSSIRSGRIFRPYLLASLMYILAFLLLVITAPIFALTPGAVFFGITGFICAVVLYNG